jgi:hypothetical protein
VARLCVPLLHCTSSDSFVAVNYSHRLSLTVLLAVLSFSADAGVGPRCLVHEAYPFTVMLAIKILS